ncbi:hypothetical protein ABTE39_19315, partial [Acinetobacter baumannii]
MVRSQVVSKLSGLDNLLPISLHRARSSLPLRLLPLALALQAIHAPAQAANYTVANGTTDTSAKT